MKNMILVNDHLLRWCSTESVLWLGLSDRYTKHTQIKATFSMENVQYMTCLDPLLIIR